MLTGEERIRDIIKKQREFFASGRTLEVSGRIAILKKLREAIKSHEAELLEAIKQDLGKSAMESYVCEVGLTLSELNYQLKHIKKWVRRVPHITDLVNFAGSSFSVYEPYGIVLVMSPWNYPFLLSLEPVIGAVAAGNCCVLKPSAYSPASSKAIANLVREVFPEEYVAVIEGGRAENTALLEQRFDYIFFTGGVTVGKLVMGKAAQHLTPVTLELGGKSPCIIEKSANLKVAATRLAFGKFLNLGQTCVAPDYLLIEESIKDKFLELYLQEVTAMYGQNALENPNYGKIINSKHFERVRGLIDEKKVIYGGQCNEKTLQIAPTVMDNVTADDAIMQEEIFGPILPVLTVKSTDEAFAFVRQREKPLAAYLFTSNSRIEREFLETVSFGGGCINDTIVHLATSRMGFGGVGNSGMGSYHGFKSFTTFSHEKSIHKKYTWLDLPLRNQPYESWKDKLIRLVLG